MQAIGRGFNSLQVHHHPTSACPQSASVAQSAEQLIRNQQVRGSTPRAGSTTALSAHWQPRACWNRLWVLACALLCLTLTGCGSKADVPLPPSLPTFLSEDLREGLSLTDPALGGIILQGFSAPTQTGRWTVTREASIEFPGMLLHHVKFTFLGSVSRENLGMPIFIRYGDAVAVLYAETQQQRSYTITLQSTIRASKISIAVPRVGVYYEHDPYSKKAGIGIQRIRVTDTTP